MSAQEPPKLQPWQINGIVAALDDEYYQVKGYALRQLAEYEAQYLKTVLKQPEDIARKAVNILKDEQVDSDIRSSAAVALGKLGEAVKPYTPVIANILKDQQVDSDIRSSAAIALGNLGEAATPYTPVIANILKDQQVDSWVRSRAAIALGNLGEIATPYTPVIANILKDQQVDSDVRGSAAIALGNLGEAATPYIPDILNILKDQQVDSWVRSSAALTLGNFGVAAQPYVPDILNILKDQQVNVSVRSSVAVALGNLGEVTQLYIPDILNFLKDEQVNALVRGSAAEALGNFGVAAQPYIPEIANILKDQQVDPWVRSGAAVALGNFGVAAQLYIPEIANILKDQQVDPWVRSSAAVALGNLGEAAQPYIPNILNFLKDQQVDSWVRSRAAEEALGNLGEAAQPYIPNILNFLKDQQVDLLVRSKAAEALGNLGEAAQPYIPNILNFLKDQQVNSLVRSRAAEVLGNFGAAAQPYIPDILNSLKDQQVDLLVRSSAASALGNFGVAAQPYIPDIANILKDEKVDSYIRDSAASALGNFGVAVQLYISNIANILKDQQVDASVRSSVAVALGKLRKLELNEVVVVLAPIYKSNQLDFEYWRFLAYFLGGGTDEVKTLLQWLGHLPQEAIDTQSKLNYKEAKQTLEVFRDVWTGTEGLEGLRDDLADQIAKVASQVSWKPQDIPLLQAHDNDLKKDGYHQADAVQSVINKLKFWQRLLKIRNTILILHITLWPVLILAYPKFPEVQAIFFWNPWVRKIIGFGYVGYLLTRIPRLRHRLFEPFKPYLKADARLDTFDNLAYFPQSQVKVPGSKNTKLITEAIPRIQGQIVLVGDSGLGKSMFLRHLVANSQRVIVYLPAQKCNQGVVEAIQVKLHGHAQDPAFLKNLIYNGAIDICIDGFNQINADTRAKITHFVERYVRGNIIIATQPLEWRPPATAKTYYLQPLTDNQIKEFLLSRQRRLPQNAKVQGKNYENSCINYLTKSLNPQQLKEELEAVRCTLSNPMDLDLVSLMLAQGKTPDLFYLQEQQYNQMAEEFRKKWGSKFPLKKFSQAVYHMCLNEEKSLPAEDFDRELLSLEGEKYKMVVSRQWTDTNGKARKEWYFRNNKIMDFFLVQNFLGKSHETEARLIDHMGDSRFRGVYFLLAKLLPLNQEATSRELIAQFLERAGAKIKSDDQTHLTIESITSSLSSYAPLPVLYTVNTPTDRDVIKLFNISKQLTTERTERAGLLLYRVSPDTTARIEIAKLRLRDHFVLIPIPLALVEKVLPDKNDCIGLLEEYVGRYIQRADFFDDKNAISDTFSFFGRTELLHRLGEELVRYQGIGLFGLRKSGKTSVLFQLGFLLREYPVIHIDLQRYGGCRYGAALFNDILQRLYTLESEVTLPRFEPFLQDKPAVELTVEFTRRVSVLSHTLQKTKYKLPILCFLDEVERIIPTSEDQPEKAEEFNACFGALRVLCQEERKLALLVADVHPDCNRKNYWGQQGVATNPVFSFFKEVFLEPFSEEDTEDMLTNIGKLMGLEFDQETPKQIHQQSGGHPFVSRQLTRLLTEKIKQESAKLPKSGNVVIEWTKAEPYLEKSLTRRSELKNFLERSIWEDLEKRDFEAAIAVLQVLACNENLITEGITEQRLLNQLRDNFTKNQCLDACLWLTDVGLLYYEEVEHKELYKTRMPLLLRWIQMQMTDEEIEECKISQQNAHLITSE
ncbi:MAG: HEAT repeat domain-containing protein [Symploca sp. SIO2D2]|nr:HEAT repeat domain-containing protein [Symploca sp. SIO2D2]